MEIILTGASLYNVPNWNGGVEIVPLQLYQYKRIAGARSSAVLFRKLIKVFESKESPALFPDELPARKLALNDFMQVVVGVVALTKRGMQRTFTCPKCKTANPRVVDLLKVFIPSAPKVPGGTCSVSIKGAATTLRYLTIEDYLKVQTWQDPFVPSQWAAFSELFNLEDEDDKEDFIAFLEDFGLLALLTEADPAKFDKQLLALAKITDIDELSRLQQAVQDISPSMADVYRTECTKCKTAIELRMEAGDYFFDLR